MTSNSHLSFPTPDTDASRDRPSLPQPLLLKDRLYVGNLHPTVDEYTLLQIFTKFGKVTKLDYLFHKAGPCKGKPRGYAFVEYGDQNDTLKALGTANGKLLRGRKLVVTYAHQAPLDHVGTSSRGTKIRKGITEATRPTTLSMLKTGLGSRSENTKDKISMMEAKLRQMEQSGSASSSPLPFCPSLPSKPISCLPGRIVNNSTHPQNRHTVELKDMEKHTPILGFGHSINSDSVDHADNLSAESPT